MIRAFSFGTRKHGHRVAAIVLIETPNNSTSSVHHCSLIHRIGIVAIVDPRLRHIVLVKCNMRKRYITGMKRDNIQVAKSSNICSACQSACINMQTIKIGHVFYSEVAASINRAHMGFHLSVVLTTESTPYGVPHSSTIITA